MCEKKMQGADGILRCRAQRALPCASAFEDDCQEFEPEQPGSRMPWFCGAWHASGEGRGD